MAPRVFGLETEYSFNAFRRRSEGCLERLMSLAARQLVHLPGNRDAGFFLANGSRLYVDTGGHPELATPEVQDPWEAVRYVEAGDRIVHDLARSLEAAEAGLELLVIRGNVDYSGTGSTWGCHESYLHTSSLGSKELADQLLPHLVSRVVFAGSGGFNPRSSGIQFTLSPRAWHLRRAVSDSSTGNRGIFHTRNESLCGPGFHRMHLLCADRLCSQTSLWLTVATTALVVALIEGGKTPGQQVRLRHPVRALRTVAADTRLESRVALCAGGRTTALAIQQHYLSQAERYTNADFMPSWTADVCARWRVVLEQLEHARGELSRSLDWMIKQSIYRDRVRGSELGAERMGFWNSLMAKLDLACPADVRMSATLRLDDLLDPKEPQAESVQALSPTLRRKGLTWEDARPFFELRSELFELETRYGVLGEYGLFEQLDRGGVLDHRVPGIKEVRTATTTPPFAGRAWLRGNAISRLSGSGSSCNWSEVWDKTNGRILDLFDPFESEEKWRPATKTRQQLLFDARRDLSRLLRTDLLA